jgi:hypothetical protein
VWRRVPASHALWICSWQRSGSTWLAEQFAALPGTRYIYEPANTPENIVTGEAAALTPVPDESPAVASVIVDALEGRVRGHWVDQFNASHFPRRTVVKDVRGLPQLGAVCSLLPEATVIVLVRHPFDCAASVVRLGWFDPAVSPREAFVAEVRRWCQVHTAALDDGRAANVQWYSYEELLGQVNGTSLDELMTSMRTIPAWRSLPISQPRRDQRSATDFASAGAPVTIDDAWRDEAYHSLVESGWAELYGRDSQQLQPIAQFVAGRRN